MISSYLRSKKTIPALVVTALLILTLGLSACKVDAEDDSLQRVIDNGVVVIATDDTYPPLEWNQDGTIVGFDIDIMAEICNRLGLESRFESSKWDGLLTGLAGGQYDAVISSMNITSERQKQADFVEYVRWAQVIVTSPSNTEISDLKNLIGKRIAVQVATTCETIANGIEDAEVSSFESFDTTFMELMNDRVDAVIIDEPVAMYYQAKDPDTFAISGLVQEKEPVGIALKKGSDSLRQAMEEALEAMRTDGTYDEIYESWFGTTEH